MTTPFGALRWSAVRVLSGRQWRSSWRSYRIAGLLLFAWLAWLTGPANEFEAHPGIAAYMIGMFVAMVATAGVIARDFESGAMLLERLHGASAIEIVGGNLLYAVGTVMAGYVVLVGVLLARAGAPWDQATWAIIGLCALGLVTTACLLTLLGALLPGYGNLAVFLGLIFVGGNLADFSAATAPAALAPVIKGVSAILPLPHVVTAAARQLGRGTFPLEQIAVLAIGGFASVLAAVLWLETREPAKGWKR